MALTKDEKAAWEAKGELDAARGSSWNRPGSDGGILSGLIDDKPETKEAKAAYDLGKAEYLKRQK